MVSLRIYIKRRTCEGTNWNSIFIKIKTIILKPYNEFSIKRICVINNLTRVIYTIASSLMINIKYMLSDVTVPQNSYDISIKTYLVQ